MKRIRAISHWSAAKLWKIPDLNSYFSRFLKGPQEYTVFERRDRFIAPGTIVHLCTQDLPEDAVRNIDGQDVVSPAYLFVQLCYELDIQEAIILGNLLCSPMHPGEKPLATKEELMNFAQKASYVWGRPRALDALTYIQDNFYSSMEVVTYMKVEMPQRLGGMGIQGKPLINSRIEITPEEARRLGQRSNYLVPDFLYEKQKIIIEYYGSVHQKTTERDRIREEILRSKGYTVVVIWKQDLYDMRRFTSLFVRLANLFNKRVRIKSTTFRAMFRSLRDLLPEDEFGPPMDDAEMVIRDNEITTFFWVMRVRERVR